MGMNSQNTDSEKYLELYLRQALDNAGASCLKFTSSVTGVPDRIVLYHGKTFFAEIKSKGGQLSERQKVMFRKFEEQGFKVHIINSADTLQKFLSLVLMS